jgi:hypothetical protein
MVVGAVSPLIISNINLLFFEGNFYERFKVILSIIKFYPIYLYIYLFYISIYAHLLSLCPYLGFVEKADCVKSAAY